MLPDFELIEKGDYSSFLEENNIKRFHHLIQFLQALPYGRTSKRDDFTLQFLENCGTCSSKHGLLMQLCELHEVKEIELMVGIFLMNEDYHPKLKPILEKYQLKSIPEAHCYLRHDGQRYDFTSPKSDVKQFEPFLVREQRCDSQQVFDWKPMIHKHYLGGWLTRNNLQYSIEELWDIREECILALS
ncbi:MAG: hypothetical protein ACK5B9_00255 [Flavobacteriia bacterium]|jgi:hypothetical protein